MTPDPNETHGQDKMYSLALQSPAQHDDDCQTPTIEVEVNNPDSTTSILGIQKLAAHADGTTSILHIMFDLDDDVARGRRTAQFVVDDFAGYYEQMRVRSPVPLGLPALNAQTEGLAQIGQRGNEDLRQLDSVAGRLKTVQPPVEISPCAGLIVTSLIGYNVALSVGLSVKPHPIPGPGPDPHPHP